MLENENYYQAQYWDEIVGSWQDIPGKEAHSAHEATIKALEFRQQGLREGINYAVSVVHHSRHVYFTN